MHPFIPFSDEQTAFCISDLHVENRLDKVSIFGEIDINLDQQGLEHAKILQSMINRVIEELESRALPTTINLKPTKKINNPFL